MGQQVSADRCARAILPCGETNAVTGGIRAGLQTTRRLVCLAIRIHTHIREIMIKTRFEELPVPRFERPTPARTVTGSFG